MRAITVAPGVTNSARLDDVAPPPATAGTALVRALALGVCGTDRDIIAGKYGSAPAGEQRLILGHESFGRVEEAPRDCGLAPGDLVVGIVRRPDPVPCPACAAGEWDMCRNGQYTERGIKGQHGYGAELFRLDPEFAVKADPRLGLHGVLIEPTSIVAKAWDHVEGIGRRSSSWRPARVLVVGAGPIGLLAALLGAQRALEVHVVDRSHNPPKADAVAALGATYHPGGIAEVADLAPDIVLECTGAPDVIAHVLGATAPAGIVCLVGLSTPGHALSLDIGKLNRTLVLRNDAVFGSVNANRKHYQMAAQSLAQADTRWLARLISRKVPVADWQQALERRPGDIKVVIDFAS